MERATARSMAAVIVSSPEGADRVRQFDPLAGASLQLRGVGVGRKCRHLVAAVTDTGWCPCGLMTSSAIAIEERGLECLGGGSRHYAEAADKPAVLG